ncbi:unnamed protein product [Auanema sp. JU1783]|nr:unnamed protein product [Auanema sp. JU1783]
MIGQRIEKILRKLRLSKDKKLKVSKKNKSDKKNKKEVQLPDAVWSRIFDFSSPFDVARWRTVSRQFNRVAEERNQQLLYLDILRIDINAILPQNIPSDGDFFRHPTTQILAHSERRSLLLAVHSHWTVNDAIRLLQMIRHFGQFAATVTLDVAVAELCVAGQCTNDIRYWFTFQTIAAGSEGTPDRPNMKLTPRPGWLPKSSTFPVTMNGEMNKLPRWNPRTQRIPIGPMFPNAKEITFQTSLSQLRRLRRFSVYETSSTALFSPDVLQLFRLSITGTKQSPPIPLRLISFMEWLNTERLGGKYCTQFS